jgi:hypothetical protein
VTSLGTCFQGISQLAPELNTRVSVTGFCESSQPSTVGSDGGLKEICVPLMSQQKVPSSHWQGATQALVETNSRSRLTVSFP